MKYNKSNYNISESFVKIPTSSAESSNKGLEWSLKPISIFLRILSGVTIPLGKPHSMFYKLVFVAYGFCTIGSNITSQIVNYMWDSHLTIKNTNIMSKAATRSAAAEGLDRGLVDIIASIQTISIHILFFGIQFTKRWQLLWLTARQLEKQFQPDMSLFRLYRKSALIACIIPFLDYSNGLWGMYYNMQAEDGSFFGSRPMMALFAFFIGCATLTASFIPVMVCLLFILAADFYNILSKRVDELREIGLKSSDPKPVLIGITDWKRKHLLLTQFVDKINSNFGLITLLVTIRGFVYIIVNSYNMVVFESNKGSIQGYNRQQDVSFDVVIYPWTGIILELFYLSSAITAAYYLQLAGNRMMSNFFRLNSSFDPPIQNMVSSTVFQVIEKPPIVSAAGFFEVNLSLIPSLVGNTITYILLIYERIKTAAEKDLVCQLIRRVANETLPLTPLRGNIIVEQQ